MNSERESAEQRATTALRLARAYDELIAWGSVPRTVTTDKVSVLLHEQADAMADELERITDEERAAAAAGEPEWVLRIVPAIRTRRITMAMLDAQHAKWNAATAARQASNTLVTRSAEYRAEREYFRLHDLRSEQDRLIESGTMVFDTGGK